MVKDRKQKAYAVTVTVKPKNEGIATYKSVTFRGIIFANSPNGAKETTFETVLFNYKDFDGSSINRPKVTRENITIKKCELFNDFVMKQS